jgi:mono/diheme cytochrome c family protein
MHLRRLFAAAAAGLVLWAACQSQPFKQGERLYQYHCANCHMDDGSGLEGMIPPLAGSDFLEKYPERIPCIIRYGLADTIVVNGKTYSQEMEGIPDLNEYEIANILNYINHRWTEEQNFLPVPEIQKALENCPDSL